MIKRRVLIVMPSYRLLNSFNCNIIDTYRMVKFNKSLTMTSVETDTLLIDIINERTLETGTMRGCRYDTIYRDAECNSENMYIAESFIIPRYLSTNGKKSIGVIYAYCDADMLFEHMSGLETLY